MYKDPIDVARRLVSIELPLHATFEKYQPILEASVTFEYQHTYSFKGIVCDFSQKRLQALHKTDANH